MHACSGTHTLHTHKRSMIIGATRLFSGSSFPTILSQLPHTHLSADAPASLRQWTIWRNMLISLLPQTGRHTAVIRIPEHLSQHHCCIHTPPPGPDPTPQTPFLNSAFQAHPGEPSVGLFLAAVLLVSPSLILLAQHMFNLPPIPKNNKSPLPQCGAILAKIHGSFSLQIIFNNNLSFLSSH